MVAKTLSLARKAILERMMTAEKATVA